METARQHRVDAVNEATRGRDAGRMYRQHHGPGTHAPQDGV